MSRRGLGDLLLGVGIGLGIGLLISPNTGEENRKILKEKGTDLINKAKEIDLDEVKDKLVDDFNKFKKEVQNMDAEKAKKILTKKGKELQDKASELYAAAREKADPVVEKAAKDVKKKLSDFLQDMSDRLED